MTGAEQLCCTFLRSSQQGEHLAVACCHSHRVPFTLHCPGSAHTHFCSNEAVSTWGWFSLLGLPLPSSSYSRQHKAEGSSCSSCTACRCFAAWSWLCNLSKHSPEVEQPKSSLWRQHNPQERVRATAPCRRAVAPRCTHSPCVTRSRSWQSRNLSLHFSYPQPAAARRAPRCALLH